MKAYRRRRSFLWRTLSRLSLILISLTGYCKSGKVKPIQRRISDMAAQFSDRKAAQALIDAGDPLLYEFYGLDLPEHDSGILQFGTTILYPGKVGAEYYMTKGHFHTILDTSEIYYGLSGHGMMLMETPEGEVEYRRWRPGRHSMFRGAGHTAASTRETNPW